MSEETGTARGPDKFRTGDVVQVISGGPYMTIFGDRDGEGDYECKWFTPHGDGSWSVELQEGFFPEGILKQIQAAPK